MRQSIQAIKRSVSIESVLLQLGVRSPLRPRPPHRLVGVCPIHPGADNPNAFVVNTGKNVWYCFTGCAAGGDVIDLVRRIKRCSFQEALDCLEGYGADRCLDVPRTLEPTAQCPNQTNREFRPYTRRLQLQTRHPTFQRLGLAEATLRSFEAGHYPGERGFLAGCLGVRLHDLQGAPIGYLGRRLDHHQIQRWGKWKLPPAFPKSQLLFSWHRAIRDPSPAIVITEGPWAVMKLQQAGINGAVALLGLTISEQQQRLLLRTRRPIVLLMDGDAPGRRATGEIATRLGSVANAVYLPDGVDPDELDENAIRDAVRPAAT